MCSPNLQRSGLNQLNRDGSIHSEIELQVHSMKVLYQEKQRFRCRNIVGTITLHLGLQMPASPCVVCLRPSRNPRSRW